MNTEHCEAMGKKRARKNETPPLRFDEKLVLNQWMLSRRLSGWALGVTPILVLVLLKTRDR